MKRRLVVFLLVCSGVGPPAAWADEIAVVLSSNLGPYQAALAGVQEGLGRSVPVLYLSNGDISLPAGTRVVVAIGGKAALQIQRKDVAMVYCMAPGMFLPSNDRKAPVVKIYMMPPAPTVMNTLKEIQPNLRTLGILGLSEGWGPFNAQMQQLGGGMGVRVIIDKMEGSDDLPDHLRALRSQINAIWIPPDPRLITSHNFNLIKEFCSSNHIPFYVPTLELVEQGATASVASSFADIGRIAAQAAKDLLAGAVKETQVYPDKPRIAVNMASASECGLKLSPELLQKVEKKIP